MVIFFCKKLIKGEQMKSDMKQILSVLLAIVLILALSLTACANDEDSGEGNSDVPDGVLKTITGKVNDNFQIISDEGIFDIDFDGVGIELTEKVGRRVEVTGYVVEEEGEVEIEERAEGEDEGAEGEDDGAEEGMKTITVTSYKLLETY